MTRLRTTWGYVWKTVWFVLGIIGAATVVEDFELLIIKLMDILP